MDALTLPDPFDIVEFIDSLARRRGRPIELLPVPARPQLPCGLLLTTHRADYIVFSADTTPLHQRHILLHEAAHLLRGHQDGSSLMPAGQVLAPDLPPTLVRRVLGRTVYTEPQEQEAELVASLILCRASPLSLPAVTARAPGLAALFNRRDAQGPGR